RPPGVHRRKDRDRSSVYRSGRRRSRGAPRLRRGVQESAGQGSLEGLDQRSDPQMRTLIANGTCVTASDTFAADVWIENGKIAALVAPGTKLGQADRTIDAKGKYVIPGGIDAHTHLDMPFGGTNSIDDFELGQRLEAVRRHLHRVALVAQQLGQRGARVGFVVDDEYPFPPHFAPTVRQARARIQCMKSDTVRMPTRALPRTTASAPTR